MKHHGHVHGTRHRRSSRHRSMRAVLYGLLRFPFRCRSLPDGLTGIPVLSLWIHMNPSQQNQHPSQPFKQRPATKRKSQKSTQRTSPTSAATNSPMFVPCTCHGICTCTCEFPIIGRLTMTKSSASGHVKVNRVRGEAI